MTDRLCNWLARKLPKNLVYWCAIRVGAYATTGEYRNEIVPEVTMMDALKRWDERGSTMFGFRLPSKPTGTPGGWSV
ncbi:MAG: hypothetical protein ACXABY_18560 [Candidatus Thorarchaeota archaeon]|jgi:hypothetical protein